MTCGIGSQSRIVICQGESGDERPDKECEADRGGTPAMQRECRKMACPTPKWDVGRWSEVRIFASVALLLKRPLLAIMLQE